MHTAAHKNNKAVRLAYVIQQVIHAMTPSQHSSILNSSLLLGKRTGRYWGKYTGAREQEDTSLERKQ